MLWSFWTYCQLHSPLLLRYSCKRHKPVRYAVLYDITPQYQYRIRKTYLPSTYHRTTILIYSNLRHSLNTGVNCCKSLKYNTFLMETSEAEFFTLVQYVMTFMQGKTNPFLLSFDVSFIYSSSRSSPLAGIVSRGAETSSFIDRRVP